MGLIQSISYFFIAAVSVAGFKTILTPIYGVLSHSFAVLAAALAT